MSHSGSHGIEGNVNNKYIALLISILALLLAIAGAFGKYYQLQVVTAQVQLSNVWSHYQSKSIKQHMYSVSKDLLLAIESKNTPIVKSTIDKWNAAIEKYDTDVLKQEGKKELADKAAEIETQLHLFHKKYHLLEFVCAMLEIGIVLSSVSIMMNFRFFVWLSIGLGSVSLVSMLFALILV